uniref:Uncharacterized protein n=1 Tax=Parascaris univalens TaxID=6257 RepID=A0A914ZU32_PARUN
SVDFIANIFNTTKKQNHERAFHCRYHKKLSFSVTSGDRPTTCQLCHLITHSLLRKIDGTDHRPYVPSHLGIRPSSITTTTYYHSHLVLSASIIRNLPIGAD